MDDAERKELAERWKEICEKHKSDRSDDYGMKSKKFIMWQYVKNLNDINDAILIEDENWCGLKSAEQIISITYDTNHGCYVVFWKYED